MGTTQLLSVPFALYAASGNPGPQGLQGEQGPAGQNGQDGQPGTDGIGITNSYIYNDSLYIVYNNSQIVNAGRVTGAQGLQGLPGTQGEQGLQGPAGPNNISISTTTDITEIIAGNGSNITSVPNNSVNWNNAYGWGNHATAGYLTSFTEIGTVASVGLSLPSHFSVSGSTVTTTGTLTATWASQNQNLVFASPNGSSGTPTFRTLTAADLPALNFSTLTPGTGLTGSSYNGSSDISDWAVSFGGSGAANIAARSDHSHTGMLTGNGTANTLAFWNGTSTLTGNSLLFWDNTSNRLGIGTSTPTAALHINGSLRLTDDSEAAGKVLTSDDYGNATWQMPSGGVSSSGTANYLPKFNSSNSLGNSLIYQDNNRIGIGTTTPTGRLIIQADAASPDDEPILEVRDKQGKTVMVLYPDSVHFFIKDPDASKAENKGAFAVSGKNSTKNSTSNFFSVNPDSVKVSKSLLIPRMTTFERDNLPFIPGEALIIFNTTDECMQIYKNGTWNNIWCLNCAPEIVNQPFDKTICSDSSTSFSVSSTGMSLLYQWQISTDGGSTWSDLSNGGTGPEYAGTTTWNLSVSNVPVTCNGYKYRVNVSASCPPGTISNVATLNVGSTPPTITANPNDQILSTGCTASFSITSLGYVLYQWQVSADGGLTWDNISNGGTDPEYAGATTASVSLSNVPLAFNNYKYRCEVSNACGPNAISSDASLTISPAPTITTQPVDTQVSESYIVAFSIVVSGVDMLYQWQQSADGGSTWNDITNGGTSPVYSGATTDSLSLESVPVGYNNYKYRCVVSHFCRPSVTSDEATLIILIPTLTTTAASSITSTTAISGGNITLNGGATVTSRGICWSTSTNPVITDSHTTDGIGTGTFISNLTGLTPGVTYYVRAYATNGIGTAYGNQISFITNTVDIGQSYQGGIVAYILQSGDPGYIAGQTHGLIAAPSDQSTGATWGCDDMPITGANGTAIGTGNQNTIDIMAGCPTGGIAAKICGDLVLGGYSDWYLPSKNELSKLYLNKAAIGGFTSSYYWSSSEASDTKAWAQNFGSGTQMDGSKFNAIPVRAIRAF